MSKRGQGISINVVIIAAIALLVLVILSVLIFRSGGAINSGTSCQNPPNSRCQSVDALGDQCGTGEIRDNGGSCPMATADSKYICCRKLQ